MTQSAATASITAAGLTVGTVTMASSATMASGNVISENPAAAAIVAKGSAVALTVSSGPAQVAVPNVVGSTQTAATTAITGAGLVLGAVTATSSTSVAAGSVISQSPAAATSVASGSTVNLTVSSGASPSANFAYVPNAGDGTLSAFSVNSSTGALTVLSGSPIAVPGSGELYEAKIAPSGKFLYVVDDSSPGKVYAFSIAQSDGSLTAVTGSPFAAGDGSQSLAFDAAGTHLYVANYDGNTISAYSLDTSTGALTPLANSPYAVSGTDPQPSQIVTAGNYLYVADFGTNSVQVFSIDAGTGELTQGVTGAPFATDTGPVSLAVDPSGSVLYTANAGQTQASISAFKINSSTGVLTAVTGNPLTLPVTQYISIDPHGKFLFVTEAAGVAVYPIDTSTGTLGTAVAGSPFATGSLPYSVSVDPMDQFVYVGNDGSANVSEFTLNSTTGVLTAIAGSPVPAGSNPDFIAIE